MNKLLFALAVMASLATHAQGDTNRIRIYQIPSYMGSTAGGWVLYTYELTPGNWITRKYPAFYFVNKNDTAVMLQPYLRSAVAASLYQPLGSYAALAHGHTFASLSAKPTTLAGYGITDGFRLPSMTGNNGKYLVTDGADAFWSYMGGNVSSLFNDAGYLTNSTGDARYYTKTQTDGRYLQGFTEQDPKRITAVAITGTTTKTVTLTHADGSTTTNTFTDLQGGSGGAQTDTIPLSDRLSGAVTAINNLQAAKVDKVSGKGLSTNDFDVAYKNKLDGIAAGATANSTDAQLRDRSTHTNVQAISTVSGLQSALDSKEPGIAAANLLGRYWNGYKQFVAFSTDSIAEGSNNLWWTAARFNTAFAGKSTSDLVEGSKLFYTDARARAAYGSTANLTDAETITWDVTTGNNKRVTLGGNRTLTIANATSGSYATLIVIQDGVGSRTLALPSGSRVAGGGYGAVMLTTTPGGVDILSVYFDGANYYWNLSKNYN